MRSISRIRNEATMTFQLLAGREGRNNDQTPKQDPSQDPAICWGFVALTAFNKSCSLLDFRFDFPDRPVEVGRRVYVFGNPFFGNGQSRDLLHVTYF